MDEPFAALDAQTRDLLHNELERIWSKTGSTIIFVTHNVREAVRLGDRVVVLTFRPGRIKRELLVDLPRPRQLEAEVARAAREILDELEEINRSLQAEYTDGVKPHVEVGAPVMNRSLRFVVFYSLLFGLWFLLAKLKLAAVFVPDAPRRRRIVVRWLH